jgi:transglutaminase-like putative cysteine protease
MNGPVEMSVIHETTYDYGAPVDLAHHLAHLRPIADPAQEVESFQVIVTPMPSYYSAGQDAYGNARLFFSIYTPHSTLTVRSESRLRISPRYGGVDFVGGVAWEEVRNALHYSAETPWLQATEFVFASPFIPILRELRDYALLSFTPGRPLRDAALDLMHRIHAEFSYQSASTDVDTPLAEAFHARVGVCQDFAHVMVGCLRALGLAARYVSGYLLTEPPPGQPRLLGADASHAWASVYCTDIADNGGWIDLDPTNDIVPLDSHVTLGWGRDYGDVAPLRGVIRGGGEHTLSVAVSVVPAGEMLESAPLSGVIQG